MSDIFVSYARQDRERVRHLASQLETHGWTIWWDRQIFAGADFDVVIQRELDAARCVLVVWSAHSIASRWVKTEAGEGLRREKLIPVLVDESYPPLAFRNIQTVAFGDSPMDGSSPAFQELLASLTHLLGSPPRQRTTPRQRTPRQRVPPIAAPPAIPSAAAVGTPAPPLDVDVASRATTATTPESDHPPSLPRLPGTGYVGPAAALTLALLIGLGWWAFSDGGTDPAPIAMSDGDLRQAGATPPGPASSDAAMAPVTAPPVVDTGQLTNPIAGEATDFGTSPPDADAITDAAVQSFVADFVAAANTADADLLLPFYADRVDYFGMGVVGLDAIREDKAIYYRRWPRVRLTLDGEATVQTRDTPGTRLVTFTSVYDVESPARGARAAGTVQTTLVVALVGGVLKTVDQKETTKSATGDTVQEERKKPGFWGRLFGKGDKPDDKKSQGPSVPQPALCENVAGAPA